MPVRAHQRLCFGPFELDNSSAELFKLGQKLKLQGQAIQILSILLEQLVTREELRQRLWPADTATFVDFDHGLNTDIRKLRQALGDEAETPRYIETLPRRGYRFIGQLAPDQDPTEKAGRLSLPPLREGPQLVAVSTASVASPETTAKKKRLSWPRIIVLALLPVVLGFVGLFFRHAWFGPTAPKIGAVRQLTFSGRVGSGAFLYA